MGTKTMRVISTTEIDKISDKDGKHYTGTTARISYKGYNLGFSSLQFEEEDFFFNDDKSEITFKCEVVLQTEPFTDEGTGEIRTGYRLMPKLDLTVL